MYDTNSKGSTRARRIGIIIAIIVFIVGAALLPSNAEYLKYNSILGEDIVDEFQKYVDWGLLDNTNGLDILQKRGNTALVGLIIMASSVIILIISRLIANSYIVAENSTAQTDLLKSTVASKNTDTTADVTQRLKQLQQLKDEGLISEEEFTKTRLEIISKI